MSQMIYPDLMRGNRQKLKTRKDSSTQSRHYEVKPTIDELPYLIANEYFRWPALPKRRLAEWLNA